MSGTTKRERLLREEELAFFGTVTAAISHDLNNVVATIEQTAGLLEDLVLDAGDGPTIEKAQAKEIAERVGKQTRRGAAIIKRMNAFAHSIDDHEREIEVDAVLETVAALARRMADRRRIALEPQPCKDRLAVRNDPFRVLQALYLSIREAVSAAPEGGRVTLAAGRQGTKVRLAVESDCKAPPKKTGLLYLEILLGEIGGEIESSAEGGRLSIRLLFPPAGHR